MKEYAALLQMDVVGMHLLIPYRQQKFELEY